MSAFKDIERDMIEESSGNILPEFTQLYQLENRIKGSVRTHLFSFCGTIKELKSKL